MTPLSYMPVTYRRRQNFVLRALIAAGFSAATAIAFDLFLANRPIGDGIIIVQIVIVGTFLLATVLGLTGRNTHECRVEGDQLLLISPRYGRRSIAIDDLIEIVEVTAIGGDSTSWFEIKVRDLGWLKVEYDAIAPLGPLRDELKRINIGIRFTERTSNVCQRCGELLFPALMVRLDGRKPHQMPGHQCNGCGPSPLNYESFVQFPQPAVR